MAKVKGCEIVGEWTRSMINHLYWCVFSTKDGNREMIMEKWLSLINHLHNKHRGHGKLYKKCAHKRLRNRKWLKHRKCHFYRLIFVTANADLIQIPNQVKNCVN